jgi:hypothetical protein
MNCSTAVHVPHLSPEAREQYAQGLIGRSVNQNGKAQGVVTSARVENDTVYFDFLLPDSLLETGLINVDVSIGQD